MKAYLQSCYTAIIDFAARNGATAIEEHGSSDKCAACPFLLIFRTEDHILHASIHWEGTPFNFADELAPSFKQGRKDYCQETFSCHSSPEKIHVSLMDHAHATRSYRHRTDLGPKYTGPDEWKSIRGQTFLRKLQ